MMKLLYVCQTCLKWRRSKSASWSTCFFFQSKRMDGSEAVLLETLQRALSQDQNVLRPAEQQLKEWEIQPGFYSTLLVG